MKGVTALDDKCHLYLFGKEECNFIWGQIVQVNEKAESIAIMQEF